MPVNTTRGPVPIPRGERSPVGHTINTSRVVEEDMTYEDEEPEIISVLPGTGWHAVVNGEGIPLVAWVAMDDAKMYGVAVGEDGRVDLVEGDVEKLDAFTGYKQAATNNDKENM